MSEALEYLPLVTGPLVFISVWIVDKRQNLRKAMVLGLVANLLLVVFGGLTNQWAFLSHFAVACAFAKNLWTTRSNKKGDRARSDATPGAHE